ncbi:MAG: SpoIID/LytB domain-containing protein, partial [Planctomycetes bacterium]|nr:SpoIID/LytB domain-containing protein [Planctomycetota bacterium]
MLRWLLKLLFLSLLGYGLYLAAIKEAPDRNPPGGAHGILAANLPERAGQPEVRILLADALTHATLAINGRVRMEAVNMQMRKQSGEFTQSVAVEVTPTGRGVKVGTELYVRVRLKNLDSQPLRLSWQGDGNAETTISIPHEIEIYGTHIEINKKQVPRVRILARLPIEEYLYGVVASEVPTSWPLEALRAQAVASRSFAYFEVRSRRSEEYDVHATVRSQVWRPSLAVEPQVKRAVDSTAGIVITEKNALIKTFFHSECGGFTADARWVFTRTPILALSGVRCRRCSDRGNRPSSWNVTYTKQEIASRLSRAGLMRQPGEIRLIQGLDQTGTPMGKKLGRVVTLELVMAGGRALTQRIPANDFRLAMGADRANLAS